MLPKTVGGEGLRRASGVVNEPAHIDGPALRAELLAAGVLREAPPPPAGVCAIDAAGLDAVAREIYWAHGAPEWLLQQADPRVSRRLATMRHPDGSVYLGSFARYA